MKTATHKLIALLALIIFAACNEKTVYHTFKTLKDETLSQSDTLSFPINIQDSTATVGVYLEIYNHNYYPYQNISLNIDNNLKDSTHIENQIVYYNLSDKKGSFNGKKINNLFLTEKKIMTIDKLQRGTHNITITSNMQDKKLRGINCIGIKILKE